jgi:hypothetical protein
MSLQADVVQENEDQMSSIKGIGIPLRRGISQEDGLKFLPLDHIRDTSSGDSNLVLSAYHCPAFFLGNQPYEKRHFGKANDFQILL